jgi:hypothetical protein
VTEFEERADEHVRVAAAGFEQPAERRGHIGRKQFAVVIVDRLVRRCLGQFRRNRYFRLV